MLKKYFVLFGLLLTLSIPLHSQIFFPIIEPDSTIYVEENDPVGRPYGGGSGYFPIIQPAESNIVINTNDFNTLKSDLDLSKIALQKVVSSLEYFRQTVVGRKYSLFEGPLICRVKTHHSIFKKMWRKRNPQSDEPCHYREFPDLCGVRVTVNYLDDIYEVMDYISSHSKSYQLQERDDKLSVPNEDG